MASAARIACVILLVGPALTARAADWELSLDLRAAESTGRESYLEGGRGKLAADDTDPRVRLGRLRAAWNQPLGEVFGAHIEASSWGDPEKNPIDLTEAWLEYRPYPRAGLRSRVRLGAFYPPMSLENRATGWETPYTLTPSAISSWVGEELRTVGLEGQLDWLGTRTGHDFDLELTGALFGWNDPAGTMLSQHGFVFADRQTPLFGRASEPRAPLYQKNEMFHEIDHRPGYYLGGQVRWLDRAVLSALHYDNRADPTVYAPALRDFAWHTEFDSAALRIETAGGWTALAQWLRGETYIAPGGISLEWAFGSESALLARRFGPHMLAARFDRFEVDTSPRAGGESGHAWTAAYSFDRGGRWRFMLEWLRVRSDVPARTLLAEAALQSETKVEMSARYLLSGSL